MTTLMSWVDVCDWDELVPDRGVCAFVGGVQIAIFRVSPDDEVFAVSNYDPFSSAFVMSRGIVGSRGDAPKVASPVYKHAFDLRTGICIDDPGARIRTFAVRVVDGRVHVESP
ncbi:MAG: nitrite reductase small subunit NirD [Actinomycetota bacterium]